MHTVIAIYPQIINSKIRFVKDYFHKASVRTLLFLILEMHIYMHILQEGGKKLVEKKTENVMIFIWVIF